MVILQLVKNSLGRRKTKAIVSLLGLAFSTTLLLVLVHVKNSISQTIERVTGQSDLIVGAPSQPSHLALYGLFRIGSTPPAIDISVYKALSEHPEIASAIPLSIMESHRGFPVTGTTNELFNRFDRNQPLTFTEGEGFSLPDSIVLGSAVAQQTGYQVGERMTLARGMEPSIEDEYTRPFTITGILAPTGSALDNSFLASINDLQKVRADFQPEQPAGNINLILLQLHNRLALLPMEQQIKQTAPSPVEVVIPDRELGFIQNYANQFADLMIAVVMLITVMALITVFFSVTSSLAERRYEIDTLRMLGARSYQVIAIGLLEPFLIIGTATITGFFLFKGIVFGLEGFMPGEWQVWMTEHPASLEEVKFLLLILFVGSLLAAIPAWKTYGQCTHPK
ncbi:hypothetical protein GZ77_07390 [Endozoicomonas montiporae]|uniref:MacB-like periplasmic core domain-containing protein n=2 Tax=Endozoicomonas montiporae TaxID=1027273 RepID=A0A081N714_9GAMM|nr:ABC transporter permease [Endozoicomonas montiporae]AMO55951.1 putative ABC transport system permease protein [Endozoicomonas montiporae CL-33]KEQ14237.1 hypothetical protein GZ77_07390 [Endozoicomonas montiporae]